MKTYQGEGGIFEVDWNSTGDKLAACVANGTVRGLLRAYLISDFLLLIYL